MSECPKGEIPYVKGVAFTWRDVGRILVARFLAGWLARWLAYWLSLVPGIKKTPLISEQGSGIALWFRIRRRRRRILQSVHLIPVCLCRLVLVICAW